MDIHLYLLLVVILILFSSFITSAIVHGVLIKKGWFTIRQKTFQYESTYIHKHKNNTLTSHGVFVFLVPVLLFFVVVCGIFSIPIHTSHFFSFVIILLIAAFIGLVGLIDDLHKTVSNSGISIYFRITAQLIVTLLAYIVFYNANIKPDYPIPFYSDTYLTTFVTVFLFMFIMNAANLTDGLDGLLPTTSSNIFVFIMFAFIFISLDSHITLKLVNISLYFSLFLIGSIRGFLVYNTYPAKAFLGDSGSFIIGFFLAFFLMQLGPLFMLLGSLPLLIAPVTAIIQVFCNVCFKFRPFAIAPIHHTFEKHLQENKVTHLYNIFSWFWLVFVFILFIQVQQ